MQIRPPRHNRKFPAFLAASLFEHKRCANAPDLPFWQKRLTNGARFAHSGGTIAGK